MNDMLLQDGDVILSPQDGTPGSSWFVWSESGKAYGMRWVPEADPSNESKFIGTVRLHGESTILHVFEQIDVGAQGTSS